MGAAQTWPAHPRLARRLGVPRPGHARRGQRDFALLAFRAVRLQESPARCQRVVWGAAIASAIVNFAYEYGRSNHDAVAGRWTTEAMHEQSVGDLDGFYRAARQTFDISPGFQERSRQRVVLLL